MQHPHVWPFEEKKKSFFFLSQEINDLPLEVELLLSNKKKKKSGSKKSCFCHPIGTISECGGDSQCRKLSHVFSHGLASITQGTTLCH